jgi:uncharacterized protein (DUF302 family)
MASPAEFTGFSLHIPAGAAIYNAERYVSLRQMGHAMERIIEVRHESMEIKADFERFTRNLEKFLGRFDDSYYEDMETTPDRVRERIENAAGEEGLMLFNVRDHGRLLNLVGAPGKAKQYIVGNPLIALTMTRRDIRAGLYAPLRMLVYEAGDHSVHVEFDLPSSLFGQFNDPEVTAIARSLDTKLTNLIKKAEQAAQGVIAR